MAQNPNTRAEATVTLNGKQAEMVLDSLRDKAKQVKEEIKKAEAANDSKQAAKLRRELDALQSSIRNVQRQTYDYTQVLKNINGASIRDLEKTTKLLNAEIKKLTPATVEFVQKTAQLEQVKNRLKQLNATTQQHANLWQRVTNGFNKYFGIITTLVASLTGLGMILRNLNQQAMAALADKYRDMQDEKDEKALEDKLKGIKKVLAAAQTIQKVGSDMVGALQEAETEKMNAEYEKRLTAAGNNAEEREKIEEERAKEEIEIQKKYADANFALQVLQIGISGVLAGMEAYKALAGIPVVGPALGAAAAAVGITTIAQIAKAKAERDKVKAISYHGSGSTGSSTKERVITGIEQGGYYDVEREQDSKHFNAHYNPDERGFIGKPSILVAENGTEFIANNQAVNNPTIKPVLDIIDIAQKSGSITSLNLPAVIKANQMQGYRKGGYVGSPAAVPEATATTTAPLYYDDTEMKKTLTEMKELLIHLKIYGVKAPIVLSEIEKMQSLKQKSENLGNRN